MTLKLNESILAESEILENDPAKLPAGILSRVRRVICEIGKKNANNRKYRKEVWERVLADEGFQSRIKNRQILGEMEHPENVQLKLDKDRTSHIVSNVFIDEKAGVVKADFDILPTEAGKFIHVLHEAGVKVPASTRAEGELKEAIDEDGTKYSDVVPEAYRFVTIDHTGDPSCSNTEPEAIVNAVRSHYENKSIDKNVALALLENLSSEAAKQLKESITVDEGHEDCQCSVDEKKCKKGCKKSQDAKHKADGKKLEKEIQTKFGRGVAVGEAATAEPEEEKPVQTEEDELPFEDMLWKESLEGLKALANAPRNEEWRKKLSPRKQAILKTVLRRKELGEARKVVQAVKEGMQQHSDEKMTVELKRGDAVDATVMYSYWIDWVDGADMGIGIEVDELVVGDEKIPLDQVDSKEMMKIEDHLRDVVYDREISKGPEADMDEKKKKAKLTKEEEEHEKEMHKRMKAAEAKAPVQELMCPKCKKCNVPILGKGHEKEQMCDECAKKEKADAEKKATESKEPALDFHFVQGYLEGMLKDWDVIASRQNPLENIKQRLQTILQTMNEAEEPMTEDEKLGEAMFKELSLELSDFDGIEEAEALEILNAKVADYAKLVEKKVGFKKLTKKLAGKGVKNPKALAAYIGRKKYGKKKFQKAAAAGKKLKEAVEMSGLLATLEAANEEYQKLHQSKEKVLENYVKDVSKQNEFLKALKSAEQKVRDLDAKVSATEMALAESKKVCVKLKESYEQKLKTMEETIGKEKQSLTETKDKELHTLIEQHKHELLQKYIESHFKLTGITFPKAVRALLESAKSEQEFDQLFKEYRHMVLEAGLHLNSVANITLQEIRKVDPKQAEIDKRVGMAFGG